MCLSQNTQERSTIRTRPMNKKVVISDTPTQREQTCQHLPIKTGDLGISWVEHPNQNKTPKSFLFELHADCHSVKWFLASLEQTTNPTWALPMFPAHEFGCTYQNCIPRPLIVLSASMSHVKKWPATDRSSVASS